jgi:hypothetical protein
MEDKIVPGVMGDQKSHEAGDGEVQDDHKLKIRSLGQQC